mmetsp:Transcript_55960/g.166457  ORF Transcript_55960/g.166457 Transcript_55960/m.166457 type:complete len:240 (-) Transcript_55960:593-1312(-)
MNSGTEHTRSRQAQHIHTRLRALAGGWLPSPRLGLGRGLRRWLRRLSGPLGAPPVLGEAMLPELLGPAEPTAHSPACQDLLRPVGAEATKVNLLADSELEAGTAAPSRVALGELLIAAALQGPKQVTALMDKGSDSVFPQREQILVLNGPHHDGKAFALMQGESPAPLQHVTVPEGPRRAPHEGDILFASRVSDLSFSKHLVLGLRVPHEPLLCRHQCAPDVTGVDVSQKDADVAYHDR